MISQARMQLVSVVVALSFVLLLGGAGGVASAKTNGKAQAVYTATNAAAGNAVMVFERARDGRLMAAGTYPTGGLGSGDALGSQGAVVLSENGRWLFVVDAGSDQISAFAVGRDGLMLVDTVSSGGDRPISLTAHDRLLYVLNGGDSTIVGFSVDRRGHLSMLDGSRRPLSSSAANPAQIAFNPEGDALVVTEKATNLISTFTVGLNGLASGPHAQPSAGQTPFGFAFTPDGQLLVSEAFGGATDQSAASSYTLAQDASLSVISASVRTTETAACWLVVTEDGRYAYTTNAGSSSVSGYRVAGDGRLSLLNSDGVTGLTGAGSAPIDPALSKDSRFLYVLARGTNTISSFAVLDDGSLQPLGALSGLPASVVGLAAR